MKLMNDETIYHYNQLIKGMIDTYIESGNEFNLVLETDKNWEPSLVGEVPNLNKTITILVGGDTLDEAVVSEDATIIKCLLPTHNGHKMFNYYLTADSKVFYILSAENDEIGIPVFVRPQILIDSEEALEKHSKNVFLNNPKNADFFK